MARTYVNATIFGVPIVGLRNLWEPATTYRGQPTQQPNYLTAVVIKKTQAHWSKEPVMAGFTAACMELYSKALTHIPFEQVVWPVKDGDMPSEPGRQPAEWLKGHWFLQGSSSSPINVEIVQAGMPVKLVNRSQVKPGDIVTISGALAVKVNDPRGVKIFINNVLFMGPGEEIAIGNSMSGTQLMEQAKAAGLNVTGFQPSHVTSLPPVQPPAQGGFAPPPVQPPAQGGFTPPR